MRTGFSPTYAHEPIQRLQKKTNKYYTELWWFVRVCKLEENVFVLFSRVAKTFSKNRMS